MNNTYITKQKNTTQTVVQILAEKGDFQSIKNLRLVSEANKNAVDYCQIRCHVAFSKANVYVSLSGRNCLKLWKALSCIKNANQVAEKELEYLQKQKELLLSRGSSFNSLFSSRSRDFTSYHDNTLDRLDNFTSYHDNTSDRLDSICSARIALQAMDHSFYCILAHWIKEVNPEIQEKELRDFIFPTWRTRLSLSTKVINTHFSEKSKITELYFIMNRMAKEIKADSQTNNIKIIAFILLILTILYLAFFKNR